MSHAAPSLPERRLGSSSDAACPAVPERTFGAVRRHSADRSHNGSLPLLVVGRAESPWHALRELDGDYRFELLVTHRLTRTWAHIANRIAAGVMLFDVDDPLTAIVCARTAGIALPTLVVLDPVVRAESRVLEERCGVTCVQLPFSQAARDRMAGLLSGFVQQQRPCEESGYLRFDAVAQVVRAGTTTVHLSPREFALLHCLARTPGAPVATAEIVRYVWGAQPLERARPILDVYLARLRRKLVESGLGQRIRTVRGCGYQLNL